MSYTTGRGQTMKELETYKEMRDIYVKWHCPECENTADWSYYDLATRGGPVCAVCDADMVLEE